MSMVVHDSWLDYALDALRAGTPEDILAGWILAENHALLLRELIIREIERRNPKDRLATDIWKPGDPVLFLDIDGVLNGHEYNPLTQSNGITPACVARLNRVLDNTNCGIVLSSAWRYMVSGNAMSLQGFQYLLQTHQVRCVQRVIGVTRTDLQLEDTNERTREIREWLDQHHETTVFAVVDDLPLVFGDTPYAVPFVQTDETTGLTDADADVLIALLNPTRALRGVPPT